MGSRRHGLAPGWALRGWALRGPAGTGPAEDARAEDARAEDARAEDARADATRVDAACAGTGRAGARGGERAATAVRTIRVLSPRRRDLRVARARATRVRRAAPAR
ncbi:hypothetical protein [Streptomyces mirabilis]|uniref:hypothetical protein n=1 Tax=Streptomyces mirabilis TaxID=68239 RepID=UPI0033C1E3F1